jgi:4-hydroxybenzoate polyprenyltransferase
LAWFKNFKLKDINKYLKLARPEQWVKNFFIFAPLFFSFQFSIENILNILYGFILFSITASAIYTFNDYQDINEDREHPTKKFRPLANEEISKLNAILFIIILLSISLPLSFLLSTQFLKVLIIYIIINIAYSLYLKHISIVDISIIAVGFVIRIFAGATLIEHEPSMWIILVTFLLALFLSLAKRRDDLILSLNGKKTRKNITGYNLEMVNSAMTLMAGVTIVSYIMYSVSPEVMQRFGTDKLYLSAIFVIIGILRYMQISFIEENSANPTTIFLRDKFIQVTIIMWLISFVLIIKG